MNFTPLLAIYLHRIDPFAIQFTQTLGLRWYGLSYVAGFLAAYFAINFMAKRGRANIQTQQVADLILAVALGTLIGGRLGYCLFYQPSLIIQFTSQPPFWGVLAINQGGMASHGGMIGIILATLWFARKHKLSTIHLLDLLTLGGSLGIFFGRIANFVNGELLGRPCDPTFPLAVKFPQEIKEWAATNHPGHTWLNSNEFQQIETMTQALHPNRLWDKTVYHFDEIIAATQTNDAIATALKPLLTPLHPSQLYAALLEGLLIFIVTLIAWRKPRKPGVIGGLFLTIYAIVRIFDEQFRTPDAHIGYELLGLTRGQEISALMLIAGLTYLILSAKRKTKPLGGWATKS